MTRSHRRPNKVLLPSSWCFGSPAWSNLSARRDFLFCTAAAAPFYSDKNQVNFFNTAARVRRFKLTPRGSMMKTTRQDSKRESNSTIELAFMRLVVAVLKTALLIVATVATAQAEPRQSTERNRNYILRRQEVMPGLWRANDAPDHRQARDRRLPQRSDVRGRSCRRRERHSMNNQ